MKIGFIGLGIMGRPMALNLLKGGHPVTVWARRAESMQALLDAGATGADSPADAARDNELVISMVADAPDVAEVMRGVAQGAAPGLVAVDMSTIAPAAARRIGIDLAAAGVDFIDAPVSGGEVGAIAGTLSIMAGGSDSGFAKALPAFECMGKNIVHVGASGAGQVAKAANQIVTGMGVLAVAEAFAFAEKNGIPFMDGLPALAHQARRSFALWTGLQVPAEEFLQVATQAPQPIHAAASMASSAFSFGIRMEFPSWVLPVFNEINPPAWRIWSKALRSTIRSLITGKPPARQGSITMVSPSLNFLMCS